MIIHIAHLYYDLMNLYGDSGNLKAIIYSLKNQNIKYKIDYLSIKDNIDFEKYDLIYIGCGTENSLLMVLNDLIRYKNQIKEYIENNKFIVATGNSIDLFGKSINNIEALNIFNYETQFLNKRIVGDRIINTNIVKDKILGFLNCGSKMINNDIPLFDKEIGVNYKNFYGTYLLGPILVRNPEFNKYIVNKLVKSIDENFKFKKFDLKLDKEAYKSYFNTYYNQKNKD